MAGDADSLPLSQTSLYPRVKEFYAASGVQAWAGTVPLHVTCNPNLANAYATVIIRFVQDALATGRADAGQPFYVAELGAGSGKFGFHLVRRLRELRQALGLEHLRIIHVMSDVAEPNIAYWRHHPRLHPFVERGEMVFARFDAERDAGFHLMAPDSDRELGELKAFANPLVVIANYVFDSLPQDLFRITDGTIEAMWTSGAGAGGPEAAPLTWVPRPVSFPHYGDTELDRLLAAAVPPAGSNAVIFPLVALGTLRRLADAAGGRLCLLASDLGAGPGLLSSPEIQVNVGDGFFYLPVDLAIIGQFFAGLGPGLHRHLPARNLDACLSVSGFEPEELRETRLAFSMSSEVYGARGRSAISSLLEHGGPTLGPEQWLAIAAMLRYDSRYLDASVDLVGRWIEQDLLHPRLRQDVMAALRLFGAEIFWTPGSSDSYFNLGTILLELGDVKAALASYVLSIETCGPAAPTFVNMALALRALDRRPEALEALTDALAVDPTNVSARGWLGRIQLELSGELPINPPSALDSPPREPPAPAPTPAAAGDGIPGGADSDSATDSGLSDLSTQP